MTRMVRIRSIDRDRVGQSTESKRCRHGVKCVRCHPRFNRIVWQRGRRARLRHGFGGAIRIDAYPLRGARGGSRSVLFEVGADVEEDAARAA